MELEQALASARPLWFMDVDGVLNCYPQPTFDQLMASQDWADAVVNRYKIWWRPSLVSFIHRMVDEGLVQPIWLTTWITKARTELAPALGLPDFPAVEDMAGDLYPGQAWWKWQRVKALAPASGHFLWTDDQLTGPVRGFATARFPQACFPTPVSNPGLTVEDEHTIEAYLRKISGDRPQR